MPHSQSPVGAACPSPPADRQTRRGHTVRSTPAAFLTSSSSSGLRWTHDLSLSQAVPFQIPAICIKQTLSHQPIPSHFTAAIHQFHLQLFAGQWLLSPMQRHLLTAILLPIIVFLCKKLIRRNTIEVKHKRTRNCTHCRASAKLAASANSITMSMQILVQQHGFIAISTKFLHFGGLL